MAKLQELKAFETGTRPATARFSLARAQRRFVHEMETTRDESRAGLSQDVLAEWIRESAPPTPIGSEPVVLEAARPPRLSLEPERSLRHSGYRMRARPPRRTAWRASQLILCVALWSVLLLWAAGVVPRVPALSPLRDAVHHVRGWHGHAVGHIERVIEDTLGAPPAP